MHNIYIYVYIYTYTYPYIYIYIHTHIHIYIYIYISIQPPRGAASRPSLRPYLFAIDVCLCFRNSFSLVCYLSFFISLFFVVCCLCMFVHTFEHLFAGPPRGLLSCYMRDRLLTPTPTPGDLLNSLNVL